MCRAWWIPRWFPTSLFNHMGLSFCLVHYASLLCWLPWIWIPSGRVHYRMQNEMSSMYTTNLIRKSHHTGTSTDIGLIVEQMLCGNWKNCWKYKVLVDLVSLFRCGGLVSFYAVTALKKILWFSAWYYSWGFHNTRHIFVMLSQKWELEERFWSLSLSTLYMV